MPTKDELTASLAEANAKITELEAGGEGPVLDWADEPLKDGVAYLATEAGLVEQEPDVEGLSVRDRIVAIVGDDRHTDATVRALEEAGAVDDAGFTADEMDDMVLHVLLRPATSDDGEEGDSDEVTMLKADLQAVTVQRDEARNANAALERRLLDAGTTHGSIDSLEPVV